MSSRFYLRSIILIALATLFTACGGGGGGSDSGGSVGGFNTIEFTALPRALTVDEGESVTLTLNPQNTNGMRLTYEWRVTFQGEAVNFDGQDTSTISFVAPEVSGPGLVSVSVNYDLVDGNLIGPSRDNTSVRITDTTPPSEVPIEQRLKQLTGSVFDEVIPEVDEFALANLGAQSTWASTIFLSITESDVDSSISVVTARQSTAFVKRDEQNVPVYESCNSELSGPLAEFIALEQDPDLCPDDTFEVKRYQDEDTIEIRGFCQGTLFIAQKLQRLSDGIRQDYGQLNITVDDADDVSATQNVCFDTTRVIAYDATNEQALSILEIEAQHQGEPLQLVLNSDEINMGRDLSILGPDQINSISLQSSALPEFTDENFRSGLFEFERWEADVIEGEFDASFGTSTGVRGFEGTFLLNRN